MVETKNSSRRRIQQGGADILEKRSLLCSPTSTQRHSKALSISAEHCLGDMSLSVTFSWGWCLFILLKCFVLGFFKDKSPSHHYQLLQRFISTVHVQHVFKLHPSIFFFLPNGLGPRVRGGYTLDRPPVDGRTNIEKQTTIHTYICAINHFIISN